MQIRYGITVPSPLTPQEAVTHILSQRHIDDINSFLHPPHPTTLTLEQIGFAKEKKILTALLEKIKKEKQTIVVYTDYDADGITGGAIMWETLHHLGFQVFPYVPHRKTEGYGFSKKGIDAAIAKYNPALFISVDHGISAKAEVAYIASKKIPVIITDHHTKPDDPPDQALVTFHFPAVSGAGVAYLVAMDIARHFNMDSELFTRLFKIDLLALAALGIIADLVPLVGYARMITSHGLQAFQKATKPGIRALLKTAGLSDSLISTYHLGFALAPRINAVGRLSHAIDALRMLCTTNEVRAQELALAANHFNTKRQRLVETAILEAMQLFSITPLPQILLAENPKWDEGIIGLIASKLTEKFYTPSIVLTKTEQGWKGSARSIKGFDITQFLRSLQILKHVGGHPQAAGFSVDDTHKTLLCRQIEKAAHTIPPYPEKELYVDMSIPIKSLSLALADALRTLEPFGVGNPHPLFQSTVRIVKAVPMGKIGQHAKLTITDPSHTTVQYEAVYFNLSDEQKALIHQVHDASLIYTIEVNEWQGKRKPVCHVKMIV